ncbi:hypothetical protein BsWGS_21873 [Bradybaena similaris]
MATSAREDLYKYKGKHLSEIKLAAKTSVKDEQTRNRDQLILNKRLKVETLEEAEASFSREEELEKITQATRLLKQSKNVESLTLVRKCFARDPKSARIFLRNEGLQALQSCFLSTDTAVLHAAAWCAINLLAATSLSARSVMHLSPLLIQFLQGSDPQMQELCAWAIGNMAADSKKHRSILLHQGCIPALTALVSSTNFLTHQARSQSVLFALINLARGDYACIRCMQDHSIFTHFNFLLGTVDAACDLCFEIGCIINFIYSRKETFEEYGDQFIHILKLVIVKLSQVIQLEDNAQRDKVILPYLHSLGNMIGLSSDMALTACDHSNFLPTIFSCLTSNTEFIQKEALWILVNFMVEPSCRVLVMCQPRFLNVTFQLCQSTDENVTLNALYLVAASSKVSAWMCQYLVERGAVSLMVQMLASSKLKVLEAALDILVDLVSATEQGMMALLASDGLALLQRVAVNESSSHLKEAISYLTSFLCADT